MRRTALAVLIATAATLSMLTACSDEPVTSAAPRTSAAAPTTPPRQDTPGQRYLDFVNANLSSTLTDDQMYQIGQTVCALIPTMKRDEMIQTITTESTRGNAAAAEIIVDSARQYLCPNAQYATEPAGPLDSFGAGTWEVGVDVLPGKYKTSGGDQCYWARLQENDGSSGDIIDNGLGAGPQTVTIREGEYFETQRCGNWTLQP